MKRTRKHSTGGLFLFEEPKPVTEVTIRQRKPKQVDGFIERFKGKDPFFVLENFLNDRKDYVTSRYPTDHPQAFSTVLFELNLYLDVLIRVKNNLNQFKINDK